MIKFVSLNDLECFFKLECPRVVKQFILKLLFFYFSIVYWTKNKALKYLVQGSDVRKNFTVIESYTRIQFKVMSRTVNQDFTININKRKIFFENCFFNKLTFKHFFKSWYFVVLGEILVFYEYAWNFSRITFIITFQ